MDIYSNLRKRYWDLRTWYLTKKGFWDFRRTHPGNDRSCNLCGWQGSSFYPWDGNTDEMCPKCLAQPRHRFLKLMLESKWAEQNVKQGRMIHVAPLGEKGLAKLFKSHFADYLSIDVEPGAAMKVMDLTNLHEVPSDSIDFMCCNDVLEHIENYPKAISEIYRVLRPGGHASLMVPIYGEKTEKVAQPTLEDYWHVWHPGKDFYDNYRNAGFEVTVYRPSGEISDARFQRHALRDNTILPWCRKPS